MHVWIEQMTADQEVKVSREVTEACLKREKTPKGVEIVM
jgi:hypothetical protein